MDYLDQLVKDIWNLEENRICSDCNMQDTLYVSINNGIFLCYQCADFHSSFGRQTSYIRNINDKFDEYLILYLIRGGNLRFKLFLKEAGLDHISEVVDKVYFTKGLDFYRRNVIKTNINIHIYIYINCFFIIIKTSIYIVSHLHFNLIKIKNYS